MPRRSRPSTWRPNFMTRPWRTQDAGRFALATIIFRLLNYGIHPFSGVMSGRAAITRQSSPAASRRDCTLTAESRTRACARRRRACTKPFPSACGICSTGRSLPPARSRPGAHEWVLALARVREQAQRADGAVPTRASALRRKTVPDLPARCADPGSRSTPPQLSRTRAGRARPNAAIRQEDPQAYPQLAVPGRPGAGAAHLRASRAARADLDAQCHCPGDSLDPRPVDRLLVDAMSTPRPSRRSGRCRSSSPGTGGRAGRRIPAPGSCSWHSARSGRGHSGSACMPIPSNPRVLRHGSPRSCTGPSPPSRSTARCSAEATRRRSSSAATSRSRTASGAGSTGRRRDVPGAGRRQPRVASSASYKDWDGFKFACMMNLLIIVLFRLNFVWLPHPRGGLHALVSARRARHTGTSQAGSEGRQLKPRTRPAAPIEDQADLRKTPGPREGPRRVRSRIDQCTLHDARGRRARVRFRFRIWSDSRSTSRAAA